MKQLADKESEMLGRVELVDGAFSKERPVARTAPVLTRGCAPSWQPARRSVATSGRFAEHAAVAAGHPSPAAASELVARVGEVAALVRGALNDLPCP